jgi:hypothetical protein
VSNLLVVMLQKSGTGPDSQWFEYKTGFYAPVTRIEWDLGTMSVELTEQNVVNYLVKNNYARLMTDDEAKAFSAESTPTPVSPPPAASPVASSPVPPWRGPPPSPEDQPAKGE